jgi:hypothetical protein
MGRRKTFIVLWHLSWAEWRILFEAGAMLVAARLVVWFVPFRRLAKGLGKTMVESPVAETEIQRSLATPIGWAVRELGRRLPWMSQCLVQAVAATWMLQRRRIPSTLYFGVAKDSGKQIKAHAWVRCGTLVLSGAGGLDQYKVVATFAAAGPGAKAERSRIPIDNVQGKDTRR